MTTCFRPSRTAASATRAGSSACSGFGLSLGDRAEAAGPRADVAQDHEGGRPLRPALGPVGALRAFADRLEPQVFDDLAREKHSRSRQGPLQPGRQPPPRRPESAGRISSVDIRHPARAFQQRVAGKNLILGVTQSAGEIPNQALADRRPSGSRGRGPIPARSISVRSPPE